MLTDFEKIEQLKCHEQVIGQKFYLREIQVFSRNRVARKLSCAYIVISACQFSEQHARSSGQRLRLLANAVAFKKYGRDLAPSMPRKQTLPIGIALIMTVSVIVKRKFEHFPHPHCAGFEFRLPPILWSRSKQSGSNP